MPMRKTLLTLTSVVAASWLGTQLLLTDALTVAHAQSSSKSKTTKRKGSTTALDAKANEIQGDFIKNAEDLAGQYYDMKEYDKARILLRSVQALDPERPNLAAKLKLLDEDLISSNETELDVNAARGWESTQVLVTAGRPIRIKADGNYKFVMSTQVTATGFVASKNPTPIDVVTELPVGALIGIIIPTDRSQGTQSAQGEKKEEKAFLIGEGCDYTPQRDGLLYLRVNAPPENKNVGKLKVTVSGGNKIGR